MESDRFDALTAWLSTPLSRRKGVSFLSMLGIVSTASWKGAEAGGKKKKKKRKKKQDKKASRCGSGLSKCLDQCVDLKTDPLFCGDCYSECDDTQECRQGVCMPPCSERACFVQEINGPDGFYQIAVGPDNTLIATTGGDSLAVLRTSGELVRTIGEYGLDPGEFNEPTGVAVGPGEAIYASDWGNERIQVFQANGQTAVWPLGQDMNPGELAVTPAGTVYVLIGNRVYRLGPSGAIEYRWGPDGTADSSFNGVTSLAVDASGSVFVLDGGHDKVYRFIDGGQNNIQVLWSVGTSGVDPGEFRYPTGLSISAGQVFIADSENSRVQVLDGEDGTFLYSWPVTDEDGYPDDPYNLVIVAGRAYVTAWFSDMVVYRLT